MASLQRTLLAALGYPGAEGFDAGAAPALRALIAWLEHTKVRKALRAARAARCCRDPAWPAGWERAWDRLLQAAPAVLHWAAPACGGAGNARRLLMLMLRRTL